MTAPSEHGSAEDAFAWAQWYAARGMLVMPLWPTVAGRCGCNRPGCDRAGKHPILSEWQHKASTEPDKLTNWWGSSRDRGIGVVGGGAARLVMIDVDGPEGEDAHARLVTHLGALPLTLTARSGREDGGRHLYFRCPEGLDLGAIRNRKMRDVDGASETKIDVRGLGGYCVAPPSLHRTGRLYTFDDREAPIADFPLPWYEHVTQEKERPEVSQVHHGPPPAVAPSADHPNRTPAFDRAVLYLERMPASVEGNDGSGACLRAAQACVRGFELSDPEALRALQSGWNARCRRGDGRPYPWTPAELLHKIRDARRGGNMPFGALLRESRPLPPWPEPDGPDVFDDAIAAREREAAEHERSTESLEIKHNGAQILEYEGQSMSAEPPPMTRAIEVVSRPTFEWICVSGIFAPLPPTPWISRDLQLCPGRPAMLAGYGASGKTLALQSLALSVATGGRIWGQFSVREPLRVRHVDHEQGAHATRGRYQRLAIGLGISPEQLQEAEQHERLAIAAFPSVYLNRPEAYDAYCRAFEGVHLVGIDALRGATPGTDENDSKIRDCIDTLTRVSEATGAAFAVIHHAGKPREGHADARTVLRGSSAIFDACGSVLVVSGAKGEEKLVRHEKAAAESTGGLLEDFYLAIEDTLPDGSPAPNEAVRVLYRTREQIRPPRAPDADYQELRSLVLETVRRNPGIAGKGTLATLLGKRRADVAGVADQLLSEGAIVNRGKERAPRYFISDAPDAAA